MTLVLVVIHYALEQQRTQNLVNRAWMYFITPKSWRTLSKPVREKWIKATTLALIIYSDTQAITGIAILSAGYSQLSCGISIYHWQVVANLAWFSSVAHIEGISNNALR